MVVTCVGVFAGAIVSSIRIIVRPMGQDNASRQAFLLSHAKSLKNPPQDVLGDDLPADKPKLVQCGSQFDGRQFRNGSDVRRSRQQVGGGAGCGSGLQLASFLALMQAQCLAATGG